MFFLQNCGGGGRGARSDERWGGEGEGRGARAAAKTQAHAP